MEVRSCKGRGSSPRLRGVGARGGPADAPVGSATIDCAYSNSSSDIDQMSESAATLSSSLDERAGAKLDGLLDGLLQLPCCFRSLLVVA